MLISAEVLDLNASNASNTSNSTYQFPPPTVDDFMNRSSGPPTASQDTKPISIFFISPYTAFVLVAGVILLALRIVQMCHSRKIRRRQRALERELNSSRHDLSHVYLNHLHGIHLPHPTNGSLSVSLTLEDRVRLYQKTFRRNKHSRQLTAEDFSSNPDKGERMNHEKLNSSDSESEEFDDIEMGSDRNCIDDNDNNNDNNNDNDEDEDEQTSFIYLPMMSPLHNTDESNTDESTASSDSPKQQVDVETPAIATAPPPALLTPREKVSGTCIICFEDFQEGDTVVWSDHSTKCIGSSNDDSSSISKSPQSRCKHVFHEDCMVRYLASHSLRSKHADSAINSRSYKENPCPTCRQPFCQVSHDDLMVAVLLKSVQVARHQSQQAEAAASSARETTPDEQDDNDGDGDAHGDDPSRGTSTGTANE